MSVTGFFKIKYFLGLCGSFLLLVIEPQVWGSNDGHSFIELDSDKPKWSPPPAKPQPAKPKKEPAAQEEKKKDEVKPKKKEEPKKKKPKIKVDHWHVQHKLLACKSSVPAKSFPETDPDRHAHDGELSQLHAYLSCVWWADGPDDDLKTSYYNSTCAVAYQCMASQRTRKDDEPEDSQLLKGDLSSEDLCGVNITDLIMKRRDHSVNGESAPLTDICDHKKDVDPIDLICPNVRAESRMKARGSYRSSPNPCTPEGEGYYSALMKFQLEPSTITVPD